MTDPQPDDRPARVRVRRAPRFGVFAGIGVVLGLLAALILTSVFPVDEKVGFAGTFGYLALYGVVAGVVVGTLVSLVLDAVLSRRAREVDAEVEIVETPDAESAAAEEVDPEMDAEASAAAEPAPDDELPPDPDAAAPGDPR